MKQTRRLIEQKTHIGFRLPVQMKRDLETLRQRRGPDCDVSDLCREAIREYLASRLKQAS